MEPATENVDASNCFHDQWNIFIPQDMLMQSPGVLVGSISWSNGFITVLGIGHQNERSERFIGYWHGENKEAFGTASCLSRTSRCFQNKQPPVLHLCKESANQISCKLSVQDDENELKPPVCIVFDPADILHSYIFTSPKHILACDGGSNHTRHSYPFSKSSVVGENIAHVLHQHQDEKRCVSETLACTKSDVSLAASLSKQILSVFPFFIMSMFAALHQIFNSRFPYLKRILGHPSFSSHFMARCRRSHHLLKMSDKISFQRYLKYNAYSQHLLESLIGVVILYLVVNNNLSDIFTSSLLNWAEDVASRLNDLIKWLMGAPAGLKLNSQLTSMLGHFFLYHIYLWTGYLSILRTALPWLLVFASWAGVLGVSFQLCIVQDILSMLTLHIYCFYVYAARIFHLQTSALASLWRLFRGKKWNTLRSRVDSAAYNTDQLFVGTLLFTVLLFLLPTTALYYAVFTALRCAILLVQAVLSKLIHCVSIIPVYSLLLYFLRPQWIAGAVEFDLIHPSKPPSCLVLTMKTARLPLDKLLHLTTPYLREVRVSPYSWPELFSSIFTGKIIYPWVESTEAQSDHNEKTKDD